LGEGLKASLVTTLNMNIKEIFKITGIPVLVASLCCLGPSILVALGISTVAFGSSLADTWYGQYKWVFRGIGLLALIVSLVLYFRSKNICTLDQAKRNKNKIINTVLIALIVCVVAYIIWLYVIVHYIGVWQGLWN
jgi:bacteriorhodopsin